MPRNFNSPAVERQLHESLLRLWRDFGIMYISQLTEELQDAGTFEVVPFEVVEEQEIADATIVYAWAEDVNGLCPVFGVDEFIRIGRGMERLLREGAGKVEKIEAFKQVAWATSILCIRIPDDGDVDQVFKAVEKAKGCNEEKRFERKA